MILYTSGTTGKPKGAELTHLNLFRNADDLLAARPARSPPATSSSAPCPLFHSFGQTVSMNASLHGRAPASPWCPNSTPARRWRRCSATASPTSTACRRCTGRCCTTPSARASTPPRCAPASPAAPRCRSRCCAASRRPSGRSCSRATASRRPRRSPAPTTPTRERKPGSIGTPLEGVEMKVVDEDDNEVAQGEVGEIVIRGHNIMKGYWQRPDATAEAMRGGWFHSGDMARVDEEGYFYIVDRKKDLIIRGGYNVYPREVEEVLYEHPKIREAAVRRHPPRRVGRGDRRRGRPPRRRGARPGGGQRLRQGADRRLQVPARRLVPRRAAQRPDRQDPQARDRAARACVSDITGRLASQPGIALG